MACRPEMENSGGVLFALSYFILVLALTCLYAFPVVLDPGANFFGFPGDSLSGIWGIWWLDRSEELGVPFTKVPVLSYPDGWDFSSSFFPYILFGAEYLLTRFTGPIEAFNMMKLVSFPLLALSTYLLIFHLVRDRAVGAVFGVAFAFSPFHSIHMMAHFANLYWVPLALLFLIKTIREGGWLNPALLGLFWGLMAVDNAYYAFYLTVLLPVFLMLSSGDLKSLGTLGTAKSIIMASIVSFLAVLPMIYPVISGAGCVSHAVRTPNMSDIFTFSARPLDYLLPSRHNPFLGWLVPDMGIGVLKGHRYTEHTLYLGYTVLALAFYAIYMAWRRKAAWQNGNGRKDIFLFFSLALAALVLSAPPFIPLGEFRVDLAAKTVEAAHKAYLPQFFLYKLFPVFRAYARFGGLALLFLMIVAAYGLSLLTSNMSMIRRGLVLSAISVLLMTEFMELPSFRTTPLEADRAYLWLSGKKGEFAITEYPFGRYDDPYTTYEYMSSQRLHGKHLVNGPIEGGPASLSLENIRDLSDDTAMDRLSGLGVKYVVVHWDKYKKGNEYIKLDWVTEPPPEKIRPPEYLMPERLSPRLKPAARFADTEIFEIGER